MWRIVIEDGRVERELTRPSLKRKWGGGETLQKTVFARARLSGQQTGGKWYNARNANFMQFCNSPGAGRWAP